MNLINHLLFNIHIDKLKTSQNHEQTHPAKLYEF